MNQPVNMSNMSPSDQAIEDYAASVRRIVVILGAYIVARRRQKKRKPRKKWAGRTR